MYVFILTVLKRGSPICHVLLTTVKKHVSARPAGALIHRQQTIYWIFTQTKLCSIYIHKPFVTYRALKKRQTLLRI